MTKEDIEIIYTDCLNDDGILRRLVTEYCPRCGRRMMSENKIENALSRYADIYICNECGTEESLNDYFRIENDFDNWAITRFV